MLNLVDLTVGLPMARSRRRELLRWCELVATLYLESAAPVAAHVEAFHCLLRLTPESSRQIAELPQLWTARR